MDAIVRSVARLGHSVHVVVPDHRDWRRPEHDGDVHFHRYRYTPVRSWTPWGFSEALAGGSSIRKELYPVAPVVALSGIRAVRRILADDTFDVVHAHWVIPNGPIGRFGAGNTPLVVTLHGSDVAVAERSSLLARAARWSFERARAVTAPSEDLLERARRLGAREPLERIAWGADVDAFAVSAESAGELRGRLGIAGDELLLLAVGRLIPVKGFDVLLDAHAAAVSRDRRLRLAIVGDGPERAALVDRVSSLGVASSVTLVGAVPHDEIPAYLAAADAVAVPSVRHGSYVDGLPNVALEAMAAGKPLIATRVGGLPELVDDGRNGVLVDERDPPGLSSAILALAGDAEFRARLGASAREQIRAERSWEAVARQLVDVYERAIAAR